MTALLKRIAVFLLLGLIILLRVIAHLEADEDDET
jgi:hypothetical protein